MSSLASHAPAAAADGRIVYRHTAVVRVTHWVNALCFVLLVMSGLQIFNAHPALYWGKARLSTTRSFPSPPRGTPTGTS